MRICNAISISGNTNQPERGIVISLGNMDDNREFPHDIASIHISTEEIPGLIERLSQYVTD